MFSKILSITAIMLIVISSAEAAGKERVYGGVGFAASATTTPQEFVFEQPVGTNYISNGTFATTNDWTLGTGWAIGSGDATYTNTIAGTGSISQASIGLTSSVWYRLIYTVSELSGTDATITPTLGNAAMTARTANGTFTEDVFFAGTDTLTFELTSGSAATGTLDNVIMYQKPNPGWVDFIDLSGLTNGASTVHFLFNCDSTDFSYAYDAGRTMQYTYREGHPLVLDLVSQKREIFKLWYRTESGSESFVLNAR